MQGGVLVVQKNHFRANKKFKPQKELTFMTYTFTDLRYGESFDPLKPFFLSLGTNVLTATLDEFEIFCTKIGNQHRRFRRQQQIEAIRNDKS